MSSILDVCFEYEWSEKIAWREMTLADRSQALLWFSQKMTRAAGKELALPDDMFPASGISVVGNGELLCILGVFFDGPVCLAGWCITNPENSARLSHRAVSEAVDHIEYFASRRKVKHIVTMFGNRGINRILTRKGFTVGDATAQSQYRKVVI